MRDVTQVLSLIGTPEAVDALADELDQLAAQTPPPLWADWGNTISDYDAAAGHYLPPPMPAVTRNGEILCADGQPVEAHMHGCPGTRRRRIPPRSSRRPSSAWRRGGRGAPRIGRDDLRAILR